MELDRNKLVLAVVSVEVTIILVTLILSPLFQVNIFSFIYFDLKATLIGLAAFVFLTAVNYTMVFLLPKIIKQMQPIRVAYDEVSRLVVNSTPATTILIALISGFAEEIFFRGLLQTQFGLIVASIIFGGFHIGNKQTIPYGIYAMFMGLFLGWLFLYTGTLWTPILVHILNNAIAIPVMQYNYKKRQKDIF